MKIPAFLSSPSAFLASAKKAFLHEWYGPAVYNSRYSQINTKTDYENNPNKKPIDLQMLYEIIGNTSDKSYNMLSPHDKNRNHPSHNHQAQYIDYVKKSVIKNGLESHIEIEEMVSIGGRVSEMNREYGSFSRIIVKNLAINMTSDKKIPMVDNTIKSFIFGASSTHGRYNQVFDGVDIVFENNDFIFSKNHIFHPVFYVEYGVYLIFKQNKFILPTQNFSLAISLKTTHRMSMIRLMDNVFQNINLSVSGTEQGVILLEDNIIPDLRINSVDYSFKGRNRIGRLALDAEIEPIYWGAYQQLGSDKGQSHDSQRIFNKLIEYAANSNNKRQEAIFRRELLKCEASLIHKEKGAHAHQDKFILWWSGWISDYGISWTRPLRVLCYINAICAVIFHELLCPSPGWWGLFFELFNPLSNVSGEMRSSNAWLSLLTVLQKAALATLYYEIIKIFRRFSK